MSKNKFWITYFFFIIFLATAVSADTTVYFRIPGVQYFFMPIFTSSPVFSSTGFNTVNLTLYLRDIENPVDIGDLTNAAIINGTLTDPYDDIINITFNNLGVNGSYNFVYDYDYEGTYLLIIRADNDSIGWAQTQEYLYVGTYSVSGNLTTPNNTYSQGVSTSATTTIIDVNSIPQIGGTVLFRILADDNSIWQDWTNMTDIGSGQYYVAFTTPTTAGTYTLYANYSQGSNKVTTTKTITITTPTTTPPTSGGGGGGGEIRYDITPRNISSTLFVGQEIYPGIIIKNLGNKILFVEINSSLDITPSKKLSIPPNSAQELRIKISGPEGKYNDIIRFKLYALPSLPFYDKVSISYAINSLLDNGRACTRDAECISQNCEEKICKTKKVSITEKIKIRPIYIWIIIIMILLSMIGMFLLNHGRDKTQKYIQVGEKNVRRDTLNISIILVTIIIIVICILLLSITPYTPKTYIYTNTTPPSTYWQPSNIKYDITPRGISKIFLVGESVTDGFKIKNLDKNNILVEFTTGLDITPKTLNIAPGKEANITFRITGHPVGEYMEVIHTKITNTVGNISTDSIIVSFTIFNGKTLGENCTIDTECFSKSCNNHKCISPLTITDIIDGRNFSKNHPGFIIMMCIATIIAIIIIIIIHTSKLSPLHKKIWNTIAIFGVIILGATSLMIIQYNDNIKPTATISHIANGYYMHYQISPGSIDISTIKGMPAKQQLHIINMEDSKMVLTFTAKDIIISPKILVLDPLTESDVNITIPAIMAGQYLREIIIKVSALQSSEIVTIPLSYTITEGNILEQNTFSEWSKNNYSTIFLIISITLFAIILTIIYLVEKRKKK